MIMELVRRILLKNGHKTEARKIGAEIAVQAQETSNKLDMANRVLRRNITITHIIARGMGILK